ncbi:hypothetical protein SAMN02745129_0707 [Ferrimonas marina]|uniref:Immunity protein Imm33 domain-containing protein n=1 Tax=Ferrimonas marina TaxID=299255 RepID=A0A1M5MNQ6_9GAMM|nr:hypothetical protein SAMN02745129_0707 [Ferrimonas marina]
MTDSQVTQGHRAEWLIVSQQVLDGALPGFVYRERPMGVGDSGWRVFSGEESGEYLAVPAHTQLLGCSELLARLPELAPQLVGPVGRVWERLDGRWTRVSDQGESE